jgi:hypothetical protein
LPVPAAKPDPSSVTVKASRTGTGTSRVCASGQAQPQLDGDRLLLRAVVEVAFDALALLGGRGDQPGAGRGQLGVALGQGGAQAERPQDRRGQVRPAEPPIY